jgi:hypothetical protein
MKMITEYSQPVDTSTENDAKAPFHMVLVHDGERALAEARRIVERLLRRTLAGLDLHRDELSFSEIAHPEIRAEAAELAVGCDLFIFATVNGSNLPDEVVAWLHLWFESRQEKEAALVCLVGVEDGAMLGSPVHLYLQHLSDSHDIAFFSSAFIISGQDPDSRNQKHNEPLSMMRPVTTRSFPRPEGWGINE